MKKITVLFMLFLASVFQAHSQFNESFEGGIPASWTVLNGGDVNMWETIGIDPPINAHTGDFVARIASSTDAHDDYLITQQFTVTAGISDRLSLWVKDVLTPIYPESFDIYLSNTGNSPTNFTTTIAADVTTVNYNWQKFTYNLSAYVGQTVYIAFYSHTTNMYELWLDDISVDGWPTTPPSCVTNPVSDIHPVCGNFATNISWDLSPAADGYYLTAGTTPGATDIVDNLNVGYTNTYVLEDQMYNTTYYWRAVPYNIMGPAVGCPEISYTTALTGCYCNPNPLAVDGLGITKVSIGTINNATGTEGGNYGDYCALSTDVYQGLPIPFAITYETGYTYDTTIWVDWNDDHDFSDAGEEVYTGVSESDIPTTLSGSFMIAADAPLGYHRMRIGSQDSGPVTPCYNGYYAAFEDYTINVAVATCSPPAATTAVTFDCPNNQFFVQVNVTNLGSGTPSITNGTTTWPVTAVGNMQVGPFPFGPSVILALQHGSNVICNIPLGTFTFGGCPPVNDECINAIPLTLGTTYANHTVDGSNFGATNSAAPAISCFGYDGGDTWYSVMVPASGSITIETGNLSGGSASAFDSVIAVYSGTCGALTYVECDDQGADTGDFSLLTLNGQTPGDTLYINVFEYFNDSQDYFGIAAYDPSLSSTSFNISGLSVYPNPVKDVLNLSYTSDISAVTIVNVLGQEILQKNINAPQSQIDISDFATGTYLVKIKAGEIVKTMKIIKTN